MDPFKKGSIFSDDTDVTGQFKWPEYAVFGSVLTCSVAIGIFFGCFGSKNATNQEYLLGNKKMNPIPVGLSLVSSYVSSILLLGHPVEIYLYGTQIMMVLVCCIPLTLSLMYLYAPFYFNLQLTSVYEYIELRFHPFVRNVLSFINIFYCIFYMAMVVYGPALALSQVTRLDMHMLVAVIFAVCIFYSSIGGIKAVLWTDSLQAVIMLVTMAVVVIMGANNVGGLGVAWQRAKDNDRIIFFNFDPDPRARQTFWTALIGGYFIWLPSYTNQVQVQRYISLPTLNAVKVTITICKSDLGALYAIGLSVIALRCVESVVQDIIALTINMFGLWIIMGLCYIGGLVIFATYYNCDPIKNGDIVAVDQLLPKFVMDTLGGIPGLPGLFVAGITCAGLSTVSSVVNSLAANITEDYVKKYKQGLTDTKLAIISKAISVITGLLGFGFVFVAEQIGSLVSAAVMFLGILGGPTFGIFVTGMFFPWANTYGVTAGMLFTYVFMGFLGFGSRSYASKKLLPDQRLSLDVSGCPNKTLSAARNLFDITSTISRPVHWKDQEYSGLAKLFSLSELWYPAIGCIMVVFLGLLFSFIVSAFSKEKPKRKQARLFVPLMLQMWVFICPGEMKRLIDFDGMGPLEKPDIKNSESRGRKFRISENDAYKKKHEELS